MIGFEYKFITSSEIINNIKLLSQYSIFEYIILIVFIILLLATIYYIIPTLNIYLKYNEKEKDKINRKKIIKQIVMQKDINDEIEKELNIG